MENLRFVYMGFVLLAAVACSDDVRNDPALSGNIQLGAAIGDLQLNSRATADPFLHRNGIPLKAAVWFRNDNGGYDHNPDATTNLPVHTTVEFDGASPTYVLYENKNLKYPAGNTTVKCIGMYPESGWNLTADGIIAHAIDGEADLMFAKEISGSWADNFKVQEYKHLLTWIKIAVCATSHDAVDTWGTIEQITVNSDSEVTVNLQTGEPLYSGPQQEIETISAGGEPLALSTAVREVGSVLCSPEKEYTVTVKAINKSGEETIKKVLLKLNLINIDDDSTEDLAYESDAIGKCFVFSLYFTPYDVIEGMCALNSWDNQNEDIYVK